MHKKKNKMCQMKNYGVVDTAKFVPRIFMLTKFIVYMPGNVPPPCVVVAGGPLWNSILD